MNNINISIIYKYSISIIYKYKLRAYAHEFCDVDSQTWQFITQNYCDLNFFTIILKPIIPYTIEILFNNRKTYVQMYINQNKRSIKCEKGTLLRK